MSAPLRIALFAVLALSQAVGFAVIINNHFNIESEGQRLKLPIQFFDPYNPLLGRFLQLSHSLRGWHSPVAEGVKFVEGEEAYLALEDDGRGFVSVRGLSKTPPSDGLYLRTHIKDDVGDDNYSVHSQLDRYYVQEEIALAGESLIRDITREQQELDQAWEKEAMADENKGVEGDGDEEAGDEEAADQAPEESPRMWVELSVLDGKAVMTELFIDGRPLAEAVQHRRQAASAKPKTDFDAQGAPAEDDTQEKE